jgi:putative colanic acid biosynthesis UDP-glucose lipid carrier transferase
MNIFDTPLNDPGKAAIKRLEDIILSILILLLVSPLLVFIAIGVKLSSPGPVLFKQRRYGLNGEEIKVYKFRSMTTQDNGAIVKQATKSDPRISKFGSFIRRTSLDELPQFFNALQGRMSIVGPRPHAVAHNEQYRKLVPKYMQRHIVKPGITGWAQINGWRGETDTLKKMEKRIDFDLHYINNWSLWLDIKIILLTIIKGFISKNAY